MKKKFSIILMILSLSVGYECATADTLVGTLPGSISVDNKGTANYSIPLDIPAGRAGMQPELAISYNSGVGNGYLGVGFSLSGQSEITRGRSILARDGEVRGVEFSENDKFYLDGKRLLLVSGTYGEPGSEYRTEVESFSKIVASGDPGNITSFKVFTRTGRILTYGKCSGTDDAYQILDESLVTDGKGKAFVWALKRVEDRSGNYMQYNYIKDLAKEEYILSSIQYTGNGSSEAGFASVEFQYGSNRTDTAHSFIASRQQRMTKRLEHIVAKMGGTEVTRWDLGYEYSDETKRSRLTSIQCQKRKDLGSGFDSIPATEFQWKESSGIEDAVVDTMLIDGDQKTIPSDDNSSANLLGRFQRYAFGDFNGDGKDDYVDVLNGLNVYLSVGNGFAEAVNWMPESKLPGGIQMGHRNILSGDYNGDGLKDLAITSESVSKIYIVLSAGDKFTGFNGEDHPTEVIDVVPDFQDISKWTKFFGIIEDQAAIISRFSVADYTGDGRDDIVCLDYDGHLVLFESLGNDFADPVVSTDSSGQPIQFAWKIEVSTQSSWAWSVIGYDVNNYHTVRTFPGDYNGDGITDYAALLTYTGASGTDGVTLGWSTRKALQVSLSKPGGGFTRPNMVKWFDVSLKQQSNEDPNNPILPDRTLEQFLFSAIPGDFNGDGIQDFMIYTKKPSSNENKGDWTVILSKGGAAIWEGESYKAAIPESVTLPGGITAKPYYSVIEDTDWNNTYGRPYLLIGGDLNSFQFFSKVNGLMEVNMFCPDMNHDGKSDFVWYDKTAMKWCLIYSKGETFDVDHPVLLNRTNDWIKSYTPTRSTSSFLRWTFSPSADINGDGFGDWVIRSDDQRGPNFLTGIAYIPNGGQKGDLVNQVTNGLGSVSKISYRPVTDNTIYTPGVGVSYPIRELRSGWVVSDVFKDAGSKDATKFHQFTYQYSGSRLDLSGRGFLGFHSFITLDKETDLFSYQFVTQSFPMTGLVQREQVYRHWASGSNHYFRLLNSTDNDVFFDAVRKPASQVKTGSYFPFIGKSETLKFEDSNSAHYTSAGLPSGHPEQLFAMNPGSLGGHYSKVSMQTWYDGQTKGSAHHLPSGFDHEDNPPVGFLSITSLQAASPPSSISYGNPIQVKTMWGVNSGIVNTVDTSYKNDSGSWLIGLVDTTSTTATANGYSDTTAKTVYTYKPTTNLVQTKELRSNNSKLNIKTTYDYDGYGLLTREYVSGYDQPGEYYVGRFTQASYSGLEPTYKRAYQTASNALGHKTSTKYHPIHMQPVKTWDTNRGESRAVSTTYDALGRVTSVTDPMLNVTTTTSIVADDSVNAAAMPAGVDAIPLGSAYRITTTTTKQPTVYQYLDRLGREIRSIRGSYNDQIAATDTAYDILGRVVGVTTPYNGDNPAYWNTTKYDRIGRVETEVDFKGVTIRSYYNGNQTMKVVNTGTSPYPADVAVQATVTEVNDKGETIKTWNADLNPTDFGSLGTPSVEFKLDGIGRMRETVLRGQSATVRSNYDQLGNQTELMDPDTGHTLYTYNALGLLSFQQDANGNHTSISYDALSRPLVKRILEVGGATEQSDYFYFDTEADYGRHLIRDDQNGWIGSVQRIVTNFSSGRPGADYETSESYSYDNKGRVTMNLHHVDEKWYYTYARYDAYNRIDKLDYFWRPKGIENDYEKYPSRWLSYGLEYSYDANYSYVTQVKDSMGKVWWLANSGDAYDYLGRPRTFRKGNNLWTVNTYDGRSQMLVGINTGSGSIQNLSYTWDALGNLQSRTKIGVTSEIFVYDILNRLLISSAGGQNRNTTYAANGNITSKQNVLGHSGGTYAYGSSKPHAVTQAWGYNIGYDANGNMVSRSKAGDNWTSWWSGFNKPRWLVKNQSGSEFRYGVDHQRNVHLKFDQFSNGPLHYTEKKVYVGEFMEVDYLNTPTKGWEQKTTRIYVNGPTGKLGTFTFTTQDGQPVVQDRMVYHYDHLGSIDAITRFESNALMSDYGYDAWGQRRDPVNPLANGVADGNTPRGFTGHEMLDNLGLIHMNGRIYDPLLGRFLSADPEVQFPNNLQSYNRYSYSLNNPVKYIDANGHNVMVSVVAGQQDPVAGFLLNGVEGMNSAYENNLNAGKAQVYSGVAAAPVGLSMISGVGELMDVGLAMIGSATDKIAAMASLELNMATGGAAPNYAAFKIAGFFTKHLDEMERAVMESRNIARSIDNVAGENIITKLDSVIPQNLSEFSGAPLAQGELKSWSLLKGDLDSPVYRLAGGDAPTMGKSWTTIDPRSFESIEDFKFAAGIGDWNTAEKLVIGRLKSFEGAVGRTALPIPGVNKPWAPEIRLNKPAEEMIDVQEIIQLDQLEKLKFN